MTRPDGTRRARFARKIVAQAILASFIFGAVAILAAMVSTQTNLPFMGAVMGMTSTTTGGSIVAIWLPIMLFFALGWEHSVVNLFLISTAMLLGADISWADWWLWNQIPVTIGNFIGAAGMTAAGLWLAHHGTWPWQKGRSAH